MLENAAKPSEDTTDSQLLRPPSKRNVNLSPLPTLRYQFTQIVSFIRWWLKFHSNNFRKSKTLILMTKDLESFGFEGIPAEHTHATVCRSVPPILTNESMPSHLHPPNPSTLQRMTIRGTPTGTFLHSIFLFSKVF